MVHKTVRLEHKLRKYQEIEWKIQKKIHKYMNFLFIMNLALVLYKSIHFQINEAGMIGMFTYGDISKAGALYYTQQSFPSRLKPLI